MTIYRTDLVRKVAITAELKTPEAQRVVNAVFSEVANALIQRSEIRIPGFGTFKVHHRKAMNCRNPRTGEPVRVPPKDSVKFVPGKGLKNGLAPPAPSVPRSVHA